MKALYRLLALIVFFSCSTVVLADNSGPSFEGLTQDDGPEVFRIIESSGYFEVIPDEELREVRGEAWYVNVITGAIVGTMTLKLIYGDELCNSGGCLFLPWFLKPLKAY